MTLCSAWVQVVDRWHACEMDAPHPRLPHVSSDAQAVWNCGGSTTELDERIAEAAVIANELDFLKKQPT